MFTKKNIIAFAFAALLCGGAAMAADFGPQTEAPRTGADLSDPSVGSDGKRYTDYSNSQTEDMMNAIDRDHPVTTPTGR